MKKTLLLLPIAALLYFQGCDYFFPPLAGENIPPGEIYVFLKKNKDNPDVVIIDLRTKEEFDKSHLNGALNLDYEQTTFPGDIEKLKKESRYIVYSTDDRFALRTLELMRENRIEKRHMIAGGYTEWVKQGLSNELD
jgi:rhodanese-related sulfurtransferase